MGDTFNAYSWSFWQTICERWKRNGRQYCNVALDKVVHFHKELFSCFKRVHVETQGQNIGKHKAKSKWTNQNKPKPRIWRNKRSCSQWGQSLTAKQAGGDNVQLKQMMKQSKVSWPNFQRKQQKMKLTMCLQRKKTHELLHRQSNVK